MTEHKNGKQNGETDESVRNTLRFIEESPPTFYYLQLYYHDTAAPIHARSAEFGVEGFAGEVKDGPGAGRRHGSN